MSLPHIACTLQNHHSMPLQFICTRPQCIAHGKHLACLHCCQEVHPHPDSLITVKEFMVELQGKSGKTEYNLKDILLRGLTTCSTPQELSSNLQELLAYRGQSERYQKLLDPDMERLQARTAEHYQRLHERLTARTLSQKSSLISKDTIAPVLSFREGPGYTLNSPFSATNNLKNTILTLTAHPALSKFYDSITTTLRIDRVTPNWLAIGLSTGQHPYQEQSPHHLLAISNGWASLWGTLQPSKVSFGGGDQVKVKWDKELGLLEVEARGQKETFQAKSRWKDEVYLCVCLFYPGDEVSLLG